MTLVSRLRLSSLTVAYVRVVMKKRALRRPRAFWIGLRLHTLDSYNVSAQVIAIVRDHLKPGEFFKKRNEVGDGAFRRLSRKCELDLLYRVAKADSLGRNAEHVLREKWFTAEAQEWFIERARELEVEQRPPAPILLGRHLLEMGLQPGPRVGEITKSVYEMQLDGSVLTLADARNAVEKIYPQITRVTPTRNEAR